MSNTSVGFNSFALSRNLRVEDFLVDRYVDRREAISVALRRLGIQETFGSWKPVVKSSAAPSSRPAVRTAAAVAEDPVLFSAPKPIVFGILGFDYDAFKHPTVLVEGRRSRGTGGGTGGNAKGDTGQKTKPVTRPKLYGPNRQARLGANKSRNGIGTRRNGHLAFQPIKKGYNAAGNKVFITVYRCEAEPFTTPVNYSCFASVPVGLCQPRSWTQAEREASLNWVAARSAGKAARRAVNRQTFLTCDIELELRIAKRAVKSRSVSRTRGFDGADFRAARASYTAAVKEAARRVEEAKASMTVEMEMAANLRSLVIDIWANQLTDDELGDPIASIKKLAARFGTDDATIQAAVESGFKDGKIHRDRLIWNGFEAAIKSLLPNSRTLQELAENIAQLWNGKLPGGNQEAAFLARLAQIQMGLEFSSDSSKNKTEDNQDSGLSSSNGGHMPKLNYEDALNHLVELGAEHCATVQNIGYKPTGKVMIAIVAGRPVDENGKTLWSNLNLPTTVYAETETFSDKLFRDAEPQIFEGKDCPRVKFLQAEFRQIAGGADEKIGSTGEVTLLPCRSKVFSGTHNPFAKGYPYIANSVWVDTFLANFDLGCNPQVNIVYDTLTEGSPDRKPDIPSTAFIRDSIRVLMYNGTEDAESRFAAQDASDHGNLVTVNTPLSKVFEEDGVIYENKPTDRHLFVVVADIKEVEVKETLKSSAWADAYSGDNPISYAKQLRCYTGKFDLFHVTEDMVRVLYDVEPSTLYFDPYETGGEIVSPTSYWPKWATGKPVELLKRRKLTLAQQQAKRLSALERKIEAAETAHLKNKVEQADKAIKAQKEAVVAKQLKEDKVVETAPNPVETRYAEYQCEKPDYAAELKAVADYLATAATRTQVKEHVEQGLTADYILSKARPTAPSSSGKPFLVKHLDQTEDWVQKYLLTNQTDKERGSTPYSYGAWLAYIYIIGVCGDASKIHNFYWTVEDVKAIVELLDFSTRTQRQDRNIPMISCSHSDDGLYIRIHGEVAFYIDNDRMVYEMKRERAFNHTVRLELVPPTDEEKAVAKSAGKEVEPKVNMVVADSLSNFIHFVYTALLPLVANQKGFKTWSNLLPNVMAATDAKLYTLTKDKVMDQDGGAMYALMNSYPLVVAKDFVPFDDLGLWPELKGEGASSLKRMISELYVDFESVNSMVNPAVMVDLLSKYNLDFHFTKTVGLTGGLAHVNLAVLKKYAPTLFANIKENLGLDDTCVGYVVANSTKAEKGPKRLLLSLAQAGDVYEGEYGGWQLYMQPKRVKGARVYTAYAPTFIIAPGVSPFIGSREELPVCHTPKVTTNYAKSGVVTPDGQEHPFLFGESNVDAIKSANWSVRVVGEYSYVTPDQEIILKGDRTEIICAVCRGEDVDFGDYIYHEKQIEGTLKYLRWKETNSMTNGVKEVVVDYMLEWTERDPKARSIQKAQFVLTDRRLLHNKLNEAHAERLSNVKVQQIIPQDATKADATYSWLMVIGNTISANVGSNDPVYLQMFAEAKAIAKSFGKPFDDKDPVLWIDPAAALDGETYEPLKKLFSETFSVDAVWLMWEQSGPLAENLYTMYTNLVEAGKWHRIENPAELAGKPAPQNGGRWVSYAESKQEDIKGDTNILSFMLDGQGNVLNYAQRGRMFIGTETLHLANVELWETSTVKEAVSGSTQMSAFVKALSAVIDDKKVLKALQRNLFREGAETMMRLKMLMSMEQGNKFGITHESEKIPFGSTVNLNTVKGEDGKGRLVMSQKDQKMLLALLEEESGVHPSQLTSGGSLLFKDVTFALRNIVFQIDPVAANDYCGEDTVDYGSYWDDSEYEEPTDVTKSVTSWWLPALLSLSKLSTNSEENRDFVSIFFRSVLVPLLLGKSVDSVEVNRMLGVFKNFLASKNTVKLLNGRRSSGAKRIGMPNIPFGEVWVLYSEDTNSVYQQMKRDGIDVDAAYRGELVYIVNNRAPMPVGYIGCLRIIEEKDGEQFARRLASDTTKLPKLFYKVSPVQIGVDLLAVYFDGGDFDGDGHYCVSLKELNSKYRTKIQQLFAMRESALGKDMLSAECGTYFRDHYAIKSWSAATATLLNLKESVKAKALKTIEKYSDYNYNAFGVQNIGVGVMYSVYMLGEILVDFALHLKAHGVVLPAELKVLTGKDAESLVVVAAEIYEIMLGGYDEKAVELRNQFLEAIKDGKHVAVDANNTANLAKILEGMNANASKAPEVLQIMSLVAKCYAISKGQVPVTKPVLDEKGRAVAGGFSSADISHWLCSAVTVYELNRGNFDGFNGIGRPKAGGKRGKGHRTALTRSFQLIKQLKANGQGTLVSDCMPLFCLDMLHEHLGSELLGKKNSNPWSLAELNYFLVPSVGRGFKSDSEFLSILDAEVVPVEEDEDGTDGVKVGTGNTPPDDNDDNGGDDIMEPVTLEEVESEPVEELETAEAVQVQPGRVLFQDWITRKDLQANPDTYYVFGDNMKEYGMGGQAKEMRGEPNAVGIPTKWEPNMQPSAFFKDSDLNKSVVSDRISARFAALKVALLQGHNVVIPSDGIGSGLAGLAQKAPRIMEFIDAKIQELVEMFNNDEDCLSEVESVEPAEQVGNSAEDCPFDLDDTDTAPAVVEVESGPAGWSRHCPAGFESVECSSQGDKRFSALYARLSDGRTIEEAYQLDAKGFREHGYTSANMFRAANGKPRIKGQPPINGKSYDELWVDYLGLWKQWANENPALIEELRVKSSGKYLTDQFATSPQNQARALYEILTTEVVEEQESEQSEGSAALPMSDDEFQPSEPSMDGWDDDCLGVEINYDSDPADDFEGDFNSMPPDGVEVEADLDMSTPVEVEVTVPAGTPAPIADLDSALTTIQAVSNTLPSETQAKIAELLAELNRTIMSATRPVEAAPAPEVVESAPAAPAVDISQEASRTLRNPKAAPTPAPTPAPATATAVVETKEAEKTTEVTMTQSLALRGNRQVVSAAAAPDLFAAERIEVDRKIEQAFPPADTTVLVELKQKTVDQLLLERLAAAKINCSEDKVKEALGCAALLSEEQLMSLKATIKGYNQTLTGQGGAGKTYTSATTIKVFKTVGLPLLTTGTTTSSVVNIGGDGTFNSIFGLGFDAWGKTLADCIDRVRTVKDFDRLVDKLTKNQNICYKFRKLSLQAKKTPILVVVDEVSMLDSLLLSVVDTFLHKVKINVQWLLVGDPLQFEPVDGYLFNNDVVLRDGVKNVLQPSPTNSTVAGRQFVNFNLKQNRRVVGNDARVLEWLKALDDLRMGEGNCSSLPSIVNQRIEFSKNNPVPAGAIHIAFNNRVVERMNSEQVAKLMNLGAQAAKFKANVVTRVGVDPEWYVKKRRKNNKLEVVGTVFEPIEEVMTVVQGMPVIFRQRVDDSNGKMLVANSETGTVKGWHKTQGTWYIDVKLDRDGSVVPVKQVKLNLGSEYDKKGEVYQFPITAAFAISINKAQGLTISRPIVIHAYQYVRGELKPLTQNNALYVALSRVTSPDLVYFYTGINADVAYLARESFVTNKDTVAWVRSFN